MDLIIPPDFETAVRSQLSVDLAGLKAGTKLPTQDPKPDVFARILATGGYQRDLVTFVSNVTVEVFALRPADAQHYASFALSYLLRAGHSGEMGDDVCYGVDPLGLLQNYPLPSLPLYTRYVFSISVALRGITA